MNEDLTARPAETQPRFRRIVLQHCPMHPSMRQEWETKGGSSLVTANLASGWGIRGRGKFAL